MKKLIVLVASVFMLQACDDGDITLESFNFNPENVDNCPNNNLVFNINRNELLLLNIPASSFLNEETPDGSPRIVNINSSNQIFYRIYSGNLSSNNICSTIPPANPVVPKSLIVPDSRSGEYLRLRTYFRQCSKHPLFQSHNDRQLPG